MLKKNFSSERYNSTIKEVIKIIRNINMPYDYVNIFAIPK